jgi:hypothetical protein
MRSWQHASARKSNEPGRREGDEMMMTIMTRMMLSKADVPVDEQYQKESDAILSLWVPPSAQPIPFVKLVNIRLEIMEFEQKGHATSHRAVVVQGKFFLFQSKSAEMQNSLA